MGKTLGIKTLAYYIFQRTIFSFLILLIAAYLPDISIFLTTNLNVNIDQVSIDTINRVGHILVAILFLLFVLMLALGIITSLIKYFSTTYTLEDYSFKLRRGLIAKTEISIPYKQIQDVDINQSVFFRILGLSHLVILSAGNDAEDPGGKADEIFNVIDSTLAQNLREELLRRSSVEEVTVVKS